MEECPTKPSELRLPFFIGGPLHACCRSKNLHTPVWLYCATISFSAVLQCTTLLYHCISNLNYEILLNCCSVPGTVKLLLYCCTVLYCCTAEPNCTDVLYCCTVVYQVLCYCMHYYIEVYCIVSYQCTMWNCTTVLSYTVPYCTLLYRTVLYCTVLRYQPAVPPRMPAITEDV